MNREIETVDMLIVGGGINGAGIACDAAGRGLSVALYEQQDFAGATSSASSKLIHGGLRYLEQYQFRLVAEALAEREVLLKKAPHLIMPMRFVLPHQPSLRPAYLIKLGLYLYDRLSSRSQLPASKAIDFHHSGILQSQFETGFEYSDCFVDDARLVILNIIQAKQLGAKVKNYCQVIDAKEVEQYWLVTLYDQVNHQTFQKRARLLVNAAGPWVSQFIDQKLNVESEQKVRLVKGSHIILPKLYEQPHAYILQNDDQRIVFVIPYLDRFSLVGTTDQTYQEATHQVEISKQESLYLLDVVNRYFIKQSGIQDIIHSFSGLRPLCEDKKSSAQKVTRDYKLVLQHANNSAPLISIFGGKITTYRKLAESACKLAMPFFPQMKKSWTAKTPLPGGDFNGTPEQLTSQLLQSFNWLDKKIARRYIAQYGTLAWQLCGNKKGLGEFFGAGLYQLEIDYLVKNEWVIYPQDLLWRRTKLALFLGEKELQKITKYFKNSPICKGAMSAKGEIKD
ncbi:glycerol-3-phosphate dehydrogenase [Psychromonas sp. psych-6C06]|uniref:glycerol-3-phosphate dehydrogenase n=1 Tax=Psychromonas sp. psych-6C06 TaxID=2058089 RepID=UPI0019310B54|nr:glycerol-3-phosphate dehydrogenase [Psychromonas sp. psych-6C06]